MLIRPGIAVRLPDARLYINLACLDLSYTWGVFDVWLFGRNTDMSLAAVLIMVVTFLAEKRLDGTDLGFFVSLLRRYLQTNFQLMDLIRRIVDERVEIKVMKG